jgi:hypothetical protein
MSYLERSRLLFPDGIATVLGNRDRLLIYININAAIRAVYERQGELQRPSSCASSSRE